MSQINYFSNHRLINWFKLSSPSTFYPVAGKLIPFFWVLTFLFGAVGLWVSFFVAPLLFWISLVLFRFVSAAVVIDYEVSEAETSRLKVSFINSELIESLQSESCVVSVSHFLNDSCSDSYFGPSRVSLSPHHPTKRNQMAIFSRDLPRVFIPRFLCSTRPELLMSTSRSTSPLTQERAKWVSGLRGEAA